jgi:two-component system, OmpR family, copper resistance phosphate regulon response regulator CusR
MVRQLREHGVRTPVLLLTAMDATDQRIEGLDAGADDYLVKPFSLRELLARIRALMRRSFDHMKNGSELTVDDLCISLTTKKVTRAGSEIKLSRKQFELLEYLMRNAGRIVSKAEIEEHIWDRNANLWSDVVRSHIQTLRAKIDRPFDKKLIKTVHGMGYGIEE